MLIVAVEKSKLCNHVANVGSSTPLRYVDQVHRWMAVVLLLSAKTGTLHLDRTITNFHVAVDALWPWEVNVP